MRSGTAMRRVVLAIAPVLLLAAAYLLFWPVPVAPVHWSPPEDEGLAGAFSPNEILALAQEIDLAGYHGPAAIARGPDGSLYTGVVEGVILRLSGRGGAPRVVANTGGRPLGIEALPDGSLVVANALLGLQQVLPDGTVRLLADCVGDQPLRYVDDVAAGRDGKLYFTEASTKFGAAAAGGVLEAALLDILEHGGHGLLLEYDPGTKSTRILLDGLNFANGVAVSDDGRYVLVAETGSYRILKYWLEGPQRGSAEVLIDNLPGFPDKIDNGLNGRFWVGLVAPRNPWLDRYAGKPFLRAMMQRLPAFLRPKLRPAAHVIALNGDGEVLMNLQDPAARYPLLSGVQELPDRLLLSTLEGPVLPWIDKNDLL